MTSNLVVHLALRWPDDSDTVGRWQRELGVRLDLWGLVVVTPRSVHGRVAGGPRALAGYVRAARDHPALGRGSFRAGASQGPYLPRLTVMVREERGPSRSAYLLLAAGDLSPVVEARWPGGPQVLEERVRTATRRPGLLTGCELCGAPGYAYHACVAPLCSDGARLCNACADFALCQAHRN